MANKCCIETLQKLQDRLNSNVEGLLAIGAKGQSAMEKAALRHADGIVDVMGIIKAFAKEVSSGS